LTISVNPQPMSSRPPPLDAAHDDLLARPHRRRRLRTAGTAAAHRAAHRTAAHPVAVQVAVT